MLHRTANTCILVKISMDVFFAVPANHPDWYCRVVDHTYTYNDFKSLYNLTASICR